MCERNGHAPAGLQKFTRIFSQSHHHVAAVNYVFVRYGKSFPLRRDLHKNILKNAVRARIGPTVHKPFGFGPGDIFVKRAKPARNVALHPELAGRIQGVQFMLVDAETDDAPTAPLYSSWPLKDEAGTHHLHQGRLMATSGARARTLDSAVAALGLERLDCIKLDIDGAECAMLRGARTVLTRWHPTIIMELAPYVLEERGTSLGELIELLRAYGYALVDAGTGQSLALDAARLQALIPPGASLNVVARPAG